VLFRSIENWELVRKDDQPIGTDIQNIVPNEAPS